jgi:hypothetical protein
MATLIWSGFPFFLIFAKFTLFRLTLKFVNINFDRRNRPPGGPMLSHWGAEEEV